MELANWTYVLTIIFFGGLGLIRRIKRSLATFRKHWKFIVIFAVVSVPVAYWDTFGQKWGAYYYSSSHTLDIKIFGTELETYVFLAVIIAIVSWGTLDYAQKEDDARLRQSADKRKPR